MPSATVTGSNRSARAPTQKASGPSRAATEVGDDHRAAGEPVAGAEEPDRRIVGEMVRHLAHEHDVHRLVPERRDARRSPRRTARRRPARRRAATGLRSRPTGTSRMPRRAAQRDRGAGQIAQAGSEVEQGERRAGGHAASARRKPVAHRGRAAEPSVGPGDVPERRGDRHRIGRRIVEQLRARRRSRRAARAGHARAA